MTKFYIPSKGPDSWKGRSLISYHCDIRASMHINFGGTTKALGRSSAQAPASLYLLHPWSRVHPALAALVRPCTSRLDILQDLWLVVGKKHRGFQNQLLMFFNPRRMSCSIR